MTERTIRALLLEEFADLSIRRNSDGHRNKKTKFCSLGETLHREANRSDSKPCRSRRHAHFGIVAVDCTKRRSRWMLCDFYGKVIIEPTTVEHTTGGLREMTSRITDACIAESLQDNIVAVEMTGIYHRPVQRACRKAGFDTRIVHPLCPITTDNRCTSTARPTTMTWRRTFTPRSKVMACRHFPPARLINLYRRSRVTDIIWSNSRHG